MASSISDEHFDTKRKREPSPSSSPLLNQTPKRNRIDTLFDTQQDEYNPGDLNLMMGAQSPVYEDRRSSFMEPGSGYDRTPTRESKHPGSSMAHDLLGIDEELDDDEDEEEYFDDAGDQSDIPMQRSLYSELVMSSNMPEEEDQRKSNLHMSSSIFENIEEGDEDETTDNLEDKTTLPLNRSYIRAPTQAYEDEVDAFFSNHNHGDEPEFVLSSAAKMSILQQQQQFGPPWYTDTPHFLTDIYFEQYGPQDRMIPIDADYDQHLSITSYLDSKFAILGTMGSGEFAHVWKVRDLISNQVYAVKKSKNAFAGWDDRWQQLIEVDHLRRVKDSKYCVNMKNAWEERGYLYIQLELCSNGSLDRYIKFKNGRIAQEVVWRIFHEMVLGIQDIHEADIAHLDLKPSNILIDDKGYLKIADFGISVQTPVDIRWVKGEGDRRYMAPDLLRENFDKPADIFSLGLILLELATGIVLPGTGESWEMLRLGDFSKHKLALSKLSLEMSEMIEWLLTTEAKDRPTVKDIISHPTFSNIQSIQQELQTGSLSDYVNALHTPSIEETNRPTSPAAAATANGNPFSTSEERVVF